MNEDFVLLCDLPTEMQAAMTLDEQAEYAAAVRPATSGHRLAIATSTLPAQLFSVERNAVQVGTGVLPPEILLCVPLAGGKGNPA